MSVHLTSFIKTCGWHNVKHGNLETLLIARYLVTLAECYGYYPIYAYIKLLLSI